jgi:hypothetical protein
MRARERILTPTGAIRAWPAVLLSLVGVGLALVFTIGYVNRVDNRREASARAAAEAQRQASEQSRAIVCALVTANVRVYEETPPQTAAGRNLAGAWVELKLQLGC